MMIGGERGGRAASRSDLRDARPRHRRHPAHARPRAPRRHRRAGLPALRAERRRPLRQDGAQRHRVRPDGRVRRGLRHPARAPTSASGRTRVDAETTPLRDPEHYQYDFNLRDIAEVWRRGSVIASWLLDLTATALPEDPDAREVRRPRLRLRRGALDDQGGDRRSACRRRCSPRALYARFSSRGEADFQNKLLSAMRFSSAATWRRPHKVTA